MSIAHDPEAPTAPHVPPLSPDEMARRNAEAIRLLDEWMNEGDQEEQRETMAVLRKALGPDRVISSRSLFP